jgi:hypothetical protein
MCATQTGIRDGREHRFAQPRLPEFLDAELSQRQLERVANDVDRWPECGPTLRALARVVDGLATVRWDPPTPIGAEIA